MFFAALFIAVGVAILLNTFGLFTGTFWGIFWAIFFIAIGLKMMKKHGNCMMCGWKSNTGGQHCNNDHNHEGHN